MKTEKDWSYLGEVWVKYAGGQTVFFASLVDAVNSVGWCKIDKCKDRPLGYISTYTWDLCIFGDPVIFVDELGLRIPIWRVREAAMAERLHYLPNYWRTWRRKSHQLVYTFRDGPVQGIRKRRSWRGGHRYIKTGQEIRENDFLDNYDDDADEFGIKCRRRRSRRGLPTAWDDLPSSRQASKNWKRYRHNQWR